MNGAPAHLVHGMGTTLEAPTWPAITQSEAENILARFPAAGRPIALRWHSPRPFSAAALVEAGQGEFLLKRHHRSVRTPEGLAEEHRFMAHLSKAGLAVPEVMAAIDGASAIGEGEWSYELHRKAPGIDLYRDRLSWTPFLSSVHAHEAGKALARLHRAAHGFDAPARGPHPLVSSFTILPARDPLAAAAAYVAARPGLDHFLAGKPWREELARLFAALGAGLPDRLEGQPLLWTHNDWHPSNLLWSADDRVSAVFDFGLATRSCALHDLATAIERTAISWLELGDAGSMPADPDTALALIAGYHAVLPLSRDDIDTLLALLPLVHIEFALSEMHYFAGILADPDQAMMAWQDFLLAHAQWFLSVPGQHFLGQIGQGARA
ncbi:phosphotransferase [Sphingobium sp. AP49]|uniref:phosphotransferase enzyme family protein n=1 Tax=Sphingobium sp. AP49 TaxID=1144307 RepID=UPI000A30E401|nr:phosphotransferase [Sphingobium sp. AP49]WHO41193.1 phosphotransferase [Sphingobium sp. AP49]